MLKRERPKNKSLLLITITALVPCEYSPDHSACGWCHEINHYGKKKRRTDVSGKEKQTPLHGTHKVKTEISVFASMGADVEGITNNLKQLIKKQLTDEDATIDGCTREVRILK